MLRRIRRLFELLHLAALAQRVRCLSPRLDGRQPVAFFNASTRLSGLSQNAAFSLLASWVLQMEGMPVVHFVCKAGMSRCVLGTDETDLARPMPCAMCLRQSQANYYRAATHWFGWQRDETLSAWLQALSLDELLAWEQPLPGGGEPFPLGTLVLPSLRWRSRLQTLMDDESTRRMCREFMLSAWNVACQFTRFLDQIQPQAVVLFNGTHFPEAAAAWLARRRGIRVITHESGFQPFSAYFVEGQATMYPILIPPGELTPQQESRLEADLQRRWQGDFSMAGVRFWRGMSALPERLVQAAGKFDQVVSVFTNVIFDTTQMYANVVFTDMFAWLDRLVQVMRAHPATLFIFRAHPDESRPGKSSRESVSAWFERSAAALPNALLIPPQEPINSYDLVRMSKFVLTYNSTIGLEAILLGVPALAAGQAPFNAFDTVFFEQDEAAYLRRLQGWLSSGSVEVPPERQRSTRRFLYYRTYRFSLPFGEFLESTPPTGYVRLKRFHPRRLLASPTGRTLLAGLLEGKRFELDV